jgi:hypothetical protein
MILPEDQYTEYNGVKVHWVIGDINHSRAKESGLNPHWKGQAGNVIMIDDGSIWEAWGSCLGRPYQLSAWYNGITRELSDIQVNDDRENYYFHEETYNALTIAK